jgi:hypothetical protein
MREFKLDIDIFIPLHHLVIHGWLSKNVAIFITPIDFNLLFRCNYVWYGIAWYDIGIGMVWYSMVLVLV